MDNLGSSSSRRTISGSSSRSNRDPTPWWWRLHCPRVRQCPYLSDVLVAQVHLSGQRSHRELGVLIQPAGDLLAVCSSSRCEVASLDANGP